MLKSAYTKSTNEVFAWYLLSTCKQQPGESLDEFLQALKTLSKDCNFKPVTAELQKSEHIHDSFISGLQSNSIRQRLLENNTLDLNTMFNQAQSLEVAQKSLDSYSTIYETSANSMTTRQEFDTTAHTCWNCGNQSHLRSKCPAKILNVSNVDVKNIFQKFIAPKTFTQQTFFVMFPSLT